MTILLTLAVVLIGLLLLRVVWSIDSESRAFPRPFHKWLLPATPFGWAFWIAHFGWIIAFITVFLATTFPAIGSIPHFTDLGVFCGLFFGALGLVLMVIIATTNYLGSLK